MPTIDVCIATYRRPALLRALVESLSRQETDGRFDVSVNIADNDPDESARAVVSEMSGRVRIRYATQPAKNISLTRNVALSMGTGEYVAIIDDDEDVGPAWLLTHLRALDTYGADVSHGPVIPVFAENVPGYLARSGLYGSIFNPASGATKGFIPSTNNCLFRRGVLSRLDHWFDPSFGLTGGEDSEFFQRLRLTATRSVWCREAAVTEFVPPQRATVRWLVLRRYRSGLTWTRAMLMNEADVWHRALRGRKLRLLYGIGSLPAAVVVAPIKPDWLWTLVRDIPFAVGVLTSRYGAEYKEYG